VSRIGEALYVGRRRLTVPFGGLRSGPVDEEQFRLQTLLSSKSGRYLPSTRISTVPGAEATSRVIAELVGIPFSGEVDRQGTSPDQIDSGERARNLIPRYLAVSRRDQPSGVSM
jgi:hypothetical protein